MLTPEMRSLAVIGVALVACVCDVRTRRIPNVLTFGTAIAALAYALFEHGLSGFGWSAAGWLVAVAVFFPFFALGGMGAGDVKLLGALGAWFGALDALHLALYTALAGGLTGALVSYARGHLSTAFWNLWLLLAFWRNAGLRPHPDLTIRTTRGPKLAYAIPIAIGAVTTLWLR
jgi:prepilin peptidase CpaA